MLDRNFYIGCDELFLTNSGVMRCRNEANADILTLNEVLDAASVNGGGSGVPTVGVLTMQDVSEVYPHVALAIAAAWGVKQVINAVRNS